MSSVTQSDAEPQQPYVPEWNTADRVAKVRRDQCLTLVQMAAAIGCAPGAIGNWEGGTRDFNAKWARRYEEVYGVSAAWLLLGVGSPIPERDDLTARRRMKGQATR